MRCAIYLNGEYDATRAEFYRERARLADLVIAADNGYAYLDQLGVLPHVLVGDFDSLPHDLVAKARAAGVDTLVLPERKDQTDGEAAAEEALARGASAVELLGALGGAFDHEMGNVAVLRRLAQRGAAARILTPTLAASVLCAPTGRALQAAPGTAVSLLALTTTAVVSLSGLAYELSRGVLSADSSLGVSNVVVSRRATIAVHEGLVLSVVFDPEETFAPTTVGGAQGE